MTRKIVEEDGEEDNKMFQDDKEFLEEDEEEDDKGYPGSIVVRRETVIVDKSKIVCADCGIRVTEREEDVEIWTCSPCLEKQAERDRMREGIAYFRREYGFDQTDESGGEQRPSRVVLSGKGVHE